MEKYNDMMNPHDIRKLRKELRGGRIMGLFVALIGVVVVLVLWLMDLSTVKTRIWAGVIIGVIAILVCWLANRKIRIDMEMGVKVVMPKKITELTSEPIVMAWDVTHQSSNKRGMVYYVHVGQLRFSVDKEQFEKMKVGGMCELCFGAKSKIFLEIRS